MNKLKQKFREIVLNAAQLTAVIAVEVKKKKKIFLEWGRGTGKSFILAYFMKKMVQQMPGATFGLLGSSYQQILSRTLPSTKEGLALLGLFEGYDYVVGKNGYKLGFKEPIQAPDKWDNIIHFSNGAIFALVALDQKNAGRGFNFYGLLGDEAALFDPERLFVNAKSANRARKARFKKASLLGCEIYASSTPITKKGRWFTDMEEKIKKMPAKRRKDYAFIKASAKVNVDNLREGWFDEMKDEAPSELIYLAEIENVRPKEILHGFYPKINAKNYYIDLKNEYVDPKLYDYSNPKVNCLLDNDIVKDVPLILSLDWGLFNSAVVSQKLPNEHRNLKEFWVSDPKDHEDLIAEFCDYYEPIQKKVLYLYYGHDGNKQSPKALYKDYTYGDEVAKLLRKRGWTVIDMSKGKPAAFHNDKYILINQMAKENDSKFPRITINQYNCPDLIISIERTEATEGKNGIEKVKKDEKNSAMKQQHTTHLSDAFDIPIFDLYNQLIGEYITASTMPVTAK